MYKLVSPCRLGATVTNLTFKRKKNDADGQAKRVNDDKKNGCA